MGKHQIIDSIDSEKKFSGLANNITRRQFIGRLAGTGFAFACPFVLGSLPAGDERFVIEARYYEKLDHKKIRCLLCPRECVIDERERGYCGVRENREGTYYSLVYSRACAYHIDPIEKKPLFHFHPGSLAFSLATAGCNLNCKFCQNWQISQVGPEQVDSIYLPPERVAQAATENRCISIAYTYSEPTIFYEYMEDIAASAHAKDVKSVVVTAGYIAQKPLEALCKKVDAVKVDLKAFSEKYYKDIVNGELKPVLDSLVTMKKMNVWTEIVYLVVPTLNDADNELRSLCRWVSENLGADVPIHFTRFHPQYILKNLPSTPLATLERAKAIADAEGLNFVYIGNVPGHKAENTYCPRCGKMIVERIGFQIRSINLSKNQCKFCNHPIPGKWIS